MLKRLLCTVLMAGAVLVPADSALAGPPPASAAAACTPSATGNLHWSKGKPGKTWTGATISCKKKTWHRACAIVWYHTALASRPEKSKCVDLKATVKQAWRSPSAKCVPGQFQGFLYIYEKKNGKYRVVHTMVTRNLDGTSGCPTSGKTPLKKA
ncbi:hypothetical protein ABFU82_21500 [Nocardioides sp. WV_118_6]|uniref:hypothetical protein n=1 Tax=Pimelobacter sp. 30-1 TaxID=2004991 RepID=UPI001C03E55D|nr:hypothetical protein [Pimelobacter sp. 30-1]MBU2695371.1 hypothetical protein [Pimelobacter sp. 30-1]